MDFKVNPAVTETKVVEVSPATYTVTLTEKEAVVIASLVGNVTGSKEESEFRRVIDGLWESGFSKVYHSKYYPSISRLIPAPEGDL